VLWLDISQRKCGELYILKDVTAFGGSILISADRKQGLFGTRFYSSFRYIVHGQPLKVFLTLLTFKTWISYDRLMIPIAAASEKLSKVLIGMYESTVGDGSVVSSFQPLEESIVNELLSVYKTRSTCSYHD
jgi:hypothetical protein